MKKRGVRVALVTLVTVVPMLVGLRLFSVQPQVVSWEQIIGIIQVSNVARGVTGAGAPWSVQRGDAEVNLQNGDVRFRIEGLVLAGGNNIGTRAGTTQVKGTIICDNATAPFTLFDTTLVDLSPQGDARFSGNVGLLPLSCVEPAFLIRTSSGDWLAAGVVRNP